METRARTTDCVFVFLAPTMRVPIQLFIMLVFQRTRTFQFQLASHLPVSDSNSNQQSVMLQRETLFTLLCCSITALMLGKQLQYVTKPTVLIIWQDAANSI
jgi:hypothetical protein